MVAEARELAAHPMEALSELGRAQVAAAVVALQAGEADFVILHPARGLLVLEVKGGEPELRGGSWYRGKKEIKDPFEQAKKSMHKLCKEVEERTSHALKQRDFVSGFA